MKTINCRKDIANVRFAACTTGARLLSIYPVKAGRVPTSGSVSTVQFFAGDFFRDGFTPGPTNKVNLMRCEIFRGKVPPRQTQNQNTPRTRTHLRQNYE
jgi:hypothetical protein